MNKRLTSLLAIFPNPKIEETARYYQEVLGSRVIRYLEVQEPHICLYRDSTELILTQANSARVFPNRELYGYGEDAYFITEDQVFRNHFLSDEVTAWYSNRPSRAGVTTSSI
jgi:hypothetical protein